jgi:uncharacterized FlaG/YvyC family protein
VHVSSIVPEVFEATLYIQATGRPENTQTPSQSSETEKGLTEKSLKSLTKDFIKERLESAVVKASLKFPLVDRRFEIDIHEKTRGLIVKVIDAKTDEIVREIPPEKFLDLVAKIWEITGLLIDQRA